jgi:hypothetical protein
MSGTEDAVIEVLDASQRPMTAKQLFATIERNGITGVGQEAVRSSSRRLAKAGKIRRVLLPSGVLAYAVAAYEGGQGGRSPALAATLRLYLGDVAKAAERVRKAAARGDPDDEQEVSVGGEDLAGTAAVLLATLGERTAQAESLLQKVEST